MNCPRKFLFALTFAILAAGFATASDIYIAQNATGGNTGADCADAHPASWFNSAANWGSGGIGPGTTVHVCGTIIGAAGVSGILTFQGSGANGNPVTLKFENGAGLSAPYCDSAGDDSGCLVMSTPGKPHSYLVVDGGTPCGWTNTGGSEGPCNGTIVNTQSGSSLTYTSPSTNGIEAEKCTNCEIKNIGIYNLYVEKSGATSANPQGENCITYSGSSVLIHDNQMHDVGWCLFYPMVVGDNGNQVYQNDIYNTPHPMFFANATGANGVASNTSIYSNHFHDYANWNTPNCVFHVEGIHTSGPGSAPFPVFNSLQIYNNYFGPNEGSCLFSQVYLSPNTNTPGSPALVNNSTVFNNVFNLTQTGVMAITIGGGTGNAVYNNTMIGSGASGSVALNWSNISQNGNYTFTFNNNASQNFYTMVNDDTFGSEGPGISANYNIYANCVAPEGQCLNAFVNGGTSTWPAYQANSFQQEKESVPAGLVPPNKCCNGTLGLDTTTYLPQSGAIVIGAGTNLTSLCTGNLTALCSDAAGNQRPATGNWDAGAYQASSSGQKPLPPTGLSASVQ